MNKEIAAKVDETEATLVDVLTNDVNYHVVGYRVGGFNPGPNLFVLGHNPSAETVYERLTRLPTLPWMRGRLTMLFTDAVMPKGRRCLLTSLDLGDPDRVVILPYAGNPDNDCAATEGYWTVLRACRDLGMIAGRGLPLMPVPKV